jgi:pullulanase
MRGFSVLWIVCVALLSGCGFSGGLPIVSQLFSQAALRPAIRAIPQGHIRIHYRRYDGNYAGWGLHYWGSAVLRPTEWSAPQYFSDGDGYGNFVDVPISNSQGSLTFLVHRGDEKDVVEERRISGFSKQKEFWLKQEQSVVWNEQPSIAPEFVFAEFVSPTLIKGVLSSPGSIDGRQVIVRDSAGANVLVRYVEINGSNAYIHLESTADFSKSHAVVVGENTQWIRYSDAILDSEFYYGGDDLGAQYRTNGSVQIKVWSPPATAMVARFFHPQDSDREVGQKTMQRTDKGVWVVEVQPREVGLNSLDGAFYQLEVTAFGQTRLALDPYAKSMAAFNPQSEETIGKAAILSSRRSDPAGFGDDRFFNSDVMRNRADMVAYEIHVRDFTVDPNSGIDSVLRGTYPGFAKKASYLRELGVTHVQLLPLQNFYTVNETDRLFRDAKSKDLNYNWGYDPHNYFTPEGWFSTDATDPYRRVLETKQLIQTLHNAGMGVIMDVVYNHTYNANIFENVCPGCYYRRDDRGRISTFTGAGPTVESRRAMVRKLIIDSLKHFVDDYHVNGFRFDLMGFIDRRTIEMVRDALGPDVILHGEAWEFTDLPLGHGATKSNLPEGREVAAFSDTTRDAFAGRMEGRGFVQGDFSANGKVRSGLIGNIRNYNTDYDGNGYPDVNMTSDFYDRFARSPLENLGFLTVHDGFTLWDKINLSWNGTPDERSRLCRFAYSMLLSAQGRVILHGGDELARTKPLAPTDPHPERAHTSKLVNQDPDLPGIRYFHENTYKSSDYTNMVRWGRLNVPFGRDLFNYTKQVIALRRALPVLRMESSDDVSRSIRFFQQNFAFAPLAVDDPAGYKSFAEVPQLTIRFEHGVPNSTQYLTGEVYPVGESKNPIQAAFVVRFNEGGLGTLSFSREQIEKFDLKAWNDAAHLQVKLVVKAGEWSTMEGAYSPVGNNTIRASAIQKDGSVTVDLSMIDHAPGDVRMGENSYIAYEIDPDKARVLRAGGEPVPYSKFLVIHNSGNTAATVSTPMVNNPSNWVVLLDASGADANGLKNPVAKVKAGLTVVPMKSSLILGRLH